MTLETFRPLFKNFKDWDNFQQYHPQVNKQKWKEKQSQISQVDSVALNSLIIGLKFQIGHIIRARNSDNILTAITLIKRELHQLDTQ